MNPIKNKSKPNENQYMNLKTNQNLRKINQSNYKQIKTLGKPVNPVKNQLQAKEKQEFQINMNQS